MTRSMLNAVLLGMLLLAPSAATGQAVGTQAVYLGDCVESCVKINVPGHEGWGSTAGQWITGEVDCQARASYCEIQQCGRQTALLERDDFFSGWSLDCRGELQHNLVAGVQGPLTGPESVRTPVLGRGRVSWLAIASVD
jgi:hypothetical protein